MGNKKRGLRKKLEGVVRFLDRNSGYYDAIRSNLTNNSMYFCKNCELHKTCNKKKDKPRVLKTVKFVIESVFLNEYPYKGSLKNQPRWFYDLYTKRNEVLNAISREKSAQNKRK